MRGVGQTVEVTLQHVPTHLVIEWVTELSWDLEREKKKNTSYNLHKYLNIQYTNTYIHRYIKYVNLLIVSARHSNFT